MSGFGSVWTDDNDKRGIEQAVQVANTFAPTCKTVPSINPQRGWRFRKCPKSIKNRGKQGLEAVFQPVKKASQAGLRLLKPAKFTQFLQSLLI